MRAAPQATGLPMTPFDRAMPLLFVFIWATGFVLARFVAPHVEPLSFLTLRYLLSFLVFAGLAVAAGAAWPKTWAGLRNALVTGVLMQAIYLGGVFWSTRNGLPVGIAALIGGLQPLLTALLSYPLLGERVRPRQWLGIGLGFLGAFLVLAPNLGATGNVPASGMVACLVGAMAMTLGTIWQKRTAGGVDLRTNAAVQFLAAAVVTAPVAALTESAGFDGSWQAWAGLGWAVLALSVGAIWLLLIMIRRGAVASVASLFYLVPPVAAVIAFLLFGERLYAIQIGGMALAAVGVAVANRK
jgi:drug/metabolite transporter (DMT)-like permease